MHINYNSYDIVNSLEPQLLESLERDTSFAPIDLPYKAVEGLNGDKLYEPIDIAFYGTSSFSEVGQYYLKNGVYTSLHPIYDKVAFDEF